MNSIKDKVVLVTGGASGLGASMTKQFLEGGAKVVVILDIDIENGLKFSNELNATHGDNKCKFIKCDVSTEELHAAYNIVLMEFNYIDVVINNAGIFNDSPSTYLKEISVNVTALITSSLKAYNLMRKDHGGEGGTIINISSIAAILNAPCALIYSATKAAVAKFSSLLGMPIHYSRSNVRVLTICFGLTDTPILSKFEPFDKEIRKDFNDSLALFSLQDPNVAAKGVAEVFQKAVSGSTWLITSGKPAKDISLQVEALHNNFFADTLRETEDK